MLHFTNRRKDFGASGLALQSDLELLEGSLSVSLARAVERPEGKVGFGQIPIELQCPIRRRLQLI